MKKCISCGAVIDDNALFCQTCGKEQTTKHTQIFRRQGLSEDEFVAKINEWFAAYPYVANVECEFDIGYGLGMLVNRRVLNALAIRYDCLSGTNQNQYGLVALQNFGLMKKDLKEVFAEWKASNPGAIVLKTEGGTCQRGSISSLMFGGIMAANRMQVYVFFKFNRERGTAVPPLSAR